MNEKMVFRGMTEQIPVQSSNLKSIGYLPEEKILEVVFHNNRTYRYHNVAEAVFNGLKNADSAGKFFMEFIKGHYDYEEI